MLLEIPENALAFLQMLFYGTYWEPILLDVMLWVLGHIMHFILNTNTNSPASFMNVIEGPAEGWVHSIGLLGIRQWNGTLSNKPHFFSVPLVVGFTGYKIYDEQNETHFFIGTCLYVDIYVVTPPTLQGNLSNYTHIGLTKGTSFLWPKS